MKLSFLCANHRSWLEQQPLQALHCCTSAFDTWWSLYQQEEWWEALPHAGCAFESADIILSCRTLPAKQAVNWLLQCATALAKTFEKVGQTEKCQAVYALAIERLKQIRTAAPSQLEHFINIQIIQLVKLTRQVSDELASRQPTALREDNFVLH